MAKKEIKYPYIKEVKLNNKSRKGEYIMVRLAKGKSTSYYRKKTGLSLQDYADTKKEGITNKRRGARRKDSFKEYQRKVKGLKKTDLLLKKGWIEHDIDSAYNLSTFEIRRAYIDLLMAKKKGGKGAIISKKDRMFAELLSKPVNVEIWKKHLEFQITTKGENGEILTETTAAHKNKSLEEVINDINKHLSKGTQLYNQGVNQALRAKGYTHRSLTNGRVQKVSLKMVYRR